MTDPVDARAAAVAQTRRLATQRWRVSAALTGAIVAIYFGFIGLVAFRPDLLATVLQPGLSLGILLGALVIVAAWLLTYVYVSWANRTYDPALATLRAQHAAANAAASANANSAAVPAVDRAGESPSGRGGQS